MPHSGACTQDWQQGRKCHCASCCENFSTVSNFDKHRDSGKCIPPAEAGLVQNARGIWTMPGEVDIRERFARA